MLAGDAGVPFVVAFVTEPDLCLGFLLVEPGVCCFPPSVVFVGVLLLLVVGVFGVDGDFGVVEAFGVVGVAGDVGAAGDFGDRGDFFGVVAFGVWGSLGFSLLFLFLLFCSGVAFAGFVCTSTFLCVRKSSPAKKLTRP